MTSKNKRQTLATQEVASSPQHDAILRAAASLFRKKGYERTSVRELAEAVGLQSGSLFHHFKTKDEILVEVMKQGLALASAFVISAIAPASTPQLKVKALFRAYLIAMLSEQHRDYMTVLLYDFRSLSPVLARKVNQFRSDLETRWQAVLDDAFPPDKSGVGVRIKAQFIFGAMNWALQWYNPKGTLSLDELAEQFASLSLATYSLGTTPKQ